ncbi:MAG: hypothetical protein LBQ03_02895 [Puniceicoccales bacterium]|jgi:hypothetical protein|nr:hypothetical protein [Puniceicoccales bacterium]
MNTFTNIIMGITGIVMMGVTRIAANPEIKALTNQEMSGLYQQAQNSAGQPVQRIFSGPHGMPYEVSIIKPTGPFGRFNPTQVTIKPFSNGLPVAPPIIFKISNIFQSQEERDIAEGVSRFHNMDEEIWQRLGSKEYFNNLHLQVSILLSQPIVSDEDKEKVAQLLKLADALREGTSEGLAAWLELEDGERWAWHARQADFLERIGSDPVFVIYHRRQAEIERLPTIERSRQYQEQAEQALTSGNRLEAARFLAQAARQWETSEGHLAWLNWTQSSPRECIDYGQQMAELCIRTGNTESAAYFLQKIDDLIGGLFESIENLDYSLKQIELHIQSDNAESAAQLLELAGLQLDDLGNQAAWQQLKPIDRSKCCTRIADLCIQVNGKELAVRFLELAAQQFVEAWRDQTSWQQLDPIELSKYCQQMADLCIQADKKQAAVQLLNQAAKQWRTSRGQAAWQTLGHSRRADWHEYQLELFEQLGHVESITFHREQARFERLSLEGNHFQELVELALNSNNGQLAAQLIAQLRGQWNTPEAQQYRRQLAPGELSTYVQQLARLCIKSGNKERAIRSLNLADNLRKTTRGLVAWSQLTPAEHADYYQQMAELYRNADDQQTATRFDELSRLNRMMTPESRAARP